MDKVSSYISDPSSDYTNKDTSNKITEKKEDIAKLMAESLEIMNQLGKKEYY